MSLPDFTECAEIQDYIAEISKENLDEDFQIYKSRSEVEDWDNSNFVLINDSGKSIRQGTKRCQITVDVRSQKENSFEKAVEFIQKLGFETCYLTTFSETSGQFYIGHVVNDVDPSTCEHPNVTDNYQVWPPPKWKCEVCGKTVYCGCWKEYIDQVKDREISKLEFKDDICWKCKDEDPELGGGYAYASSDFRKRHWQEIMYKVKELALNDIRNELWKKAENRVREKHDVPKIGKSHISETELYRMLDELLEGYKVIHHYYPDWLNGQEIDIFIPEEDIAVEYMGRQHFEPIEYFGGEENFKQQKKRDKRKKEICEKKGVTLYYVNYDEKLENKAEEIARKIKEQN